MNNLKDKINILVVEDETIVANNIKKRLESCGYIVNRIVNNADDAFKFASELKPDIVLMDIKLKGKTDGIEAAEKIQGKINIPVIFLTSYADENTFQKAKAIMPFGYLIKPFESKELERTVELALFKHAMELKIKQSEQRLALAVRAGKTGIWEFYPSEKRLFADDSLKHLLGYSDLESLNSVEDFLSLVHPDDRNKVLEIINSQVPIYNEGDEFELKVLKKDGSIIWVSCASKKQISTKDNSFFYLGTAVDITNRKLNEETIKKSEEIFRKTFDNAGIGMAMLKPNGSFIRINKSFCDTLLYSSTEILQSNLLNLTFEKDRDLIEKSFYELLTLEKGEYLNYECRYLNSQKKVVWCVTSISLIKMQDSQSFFIVQFQDITARKEAESKLAALAENLRLLNASKDKFFSIISHDLRSPFNSLLGLSEYLSESYDELSEDEVKEVLGGLHRSAKNVYNLLTNLLDWARLQTGRLTVNKNIFKIDYPLQNVLNLYAEAIKKKKLNIIKNISVDKSLYADANMIETVLRNLLYNSIKFTPDNGTITISVSIHSGSAAVSIADTGKGMSAEDLIKLFRLDAQVRGEGTDGERGTGLGLILSKEFVEKNGGKIQVESQLGIGSNFTFTVPFAE
ncbi:MAG: PAS domain S-box protein [Ignavibacteriales bacterium]|nr:PAS domain S-box protein [Ignavibacteriales bacterium]